VPSAPDESFTARPAHSATVDGAAVAVVHAPSRMLWRLAPGRHRVRGRFGILPADGAPTRAEFVVLDVGAAGSPVLMRRMLASESDGRPTPMQSFDVTFEKHKRGELVLATVAAGGDDVARCYWSDLRIEQLPDAPR
jgi:hypothetical protein